MTTPSAPTTSEHTLSPDKILQLGFAFWGSKALLSAIGIGLFTELGQQKLSLAAIRERLHLHARSAHDFLDTLVSMGMLERDNGLYSNTAETAAFLNRSKPHDMG